MVSIQSSGLDPGPGVAGIVAVLAGVWTLRTAWRSVNRLAAMLRAETRAVADVEPGLVEIEGEVVAAGETVEGKMTGEGAVVTQYRRTTDADGRDVNVPIPQQLVPTGLNRGAVPFYVDDGTGRVLVDAASAELSIDSDAKRRSAARESREVEARLEPGDEAYVIGEAVPAAEYSPGEREGGVLRLLLGFLLSEHRRTPASAVMDDEELVVTRQGGSEFLIADTAEWRGWIRQALMIVVWGVVGAVFVAVGVYLLLDGVVGPPRPF